MGARERRAVQLVAARRADVQHADGDGLARERVAAREQRGPEPHRVRGHGRVRVHGLPEAIPHRAPAPAAERERPQGEEEREAVDEGAFAEGEEGEAEGDARAEEA